jgi:hypothetical protein
LIRATAITFWAMDRRQIFVAHLLRKFVSFSERDGPAERLMTIAHTARKQNKNVLAFLTACCEPQTSIPSLFDAEVR